MSGYAPVPAGVPRAARAGPDAVGGTWRSPANDRPVTSQAPPLAAASRRADSLAHEWPLRDFIELGVLPSSMPCARYHARQIVWEWGLTRLGESVELVVGELMTNAVSASSRLDWPFPVRMWLLSDRARVLILVWDGNPEPPARIDPADDAETGRGLLLVEALSARWDWYTEPGMRGKVVHALITG